MICIFIRYHSLVPNGYSVEKFVYFLIAHHFVLAASQDKRRGSNPIGNSLLSKGCESLVVDIKLLKYLFFKMVCEVGPAALQPGSQKLNEE